MRLQLMNNMNPKNGESSLKVITCASYYGTGSSAIGDIVSEFDSVTYTSDYEVSFLHCMYGISDLEYYLIDNPHRHNSSLALKNFMHLSKVLTGNALFKKNNFYFNNQWKKLSEEFISSLYINSYYSSSFFDSFWFPRWFYYFMRIVYKVLGLDFMKGEIHYVPVSDEKAFLTSIQRFMEKLLDSLTVETEYIYIDQLFPSSNITKVSRYINTPVFTFIVDRDPRDLYLLDKHVWKSGIVPTATAQEFCAWFKRSRITQQKELRNEQVLLIKFEDLIYKYNDSLDKIASFASIDMKSHNNQLKKFDPLTSINNTRLWETYTQDKEDIKIIEAELSDYLYPYTDEDIAFFREQVTDNNNKPKIF